MTSDAALSWFAAHTAGAPEALRARAEVYVGESQAEELVPRLAAAGEAALSAAIAAGEDRAAALNLLAADGLITLALLAQAEMAPADLGVAARALRVRTAA